jgi:biotin carboxyl carrier protein
MRRYRITHRGHDVVVDVSRDGTVGLDAATYRVAPVSQGRYAVTAPDGRTTLVTVAGRAEALWAGAGGRAAALTVDTETGRRAARRPSGGDMSAPMPATVVQVCVAVGDAVEAGAPVIVLEAMKMELTVRAAARGVVGAVHCAVGQLVTPGTALVEIVS